MVENPAPITTDFSYLRLIGNRELPEDVYDHKVRDNTETIQNWAKRVEKFKENNEIRLLIYVQTII